MIDLDAIRARHYQTNGFVGPSGFCLCGEDWPCDAAQLVALLTPERIAAALLSCNLIHRYREYAEQRPHRGMEHATDEWLAEAWAIQLHAALAKETT